MTMTESRRRRGTSELNNEERFAIGTVLSGASRKRRSSKNRKLRRWDRHELSDVSLCLLIIGICIVLYTIRCRVEVASKYPSLAGVSREFRQAYQISRQNILPAYKDLYDDVYKLATERLNPPDTTVWPEHERHPYQLKSTYGSTVQQCPVTIVVLDTKLGKPVYDFGPGQPLWFELESIGAFAADACVVLQTSKWLDVELVVFFSLLA